MHGQRIGYVRVSSFDQNPERQLEPCSSTGWANCTTAASRTSAPARAGLNLVVGRQISTKSAPTIADTPLCRLRSGSGDGDLADHLFLQIERLNDVTPAL